jgi:ParB family chromosome partitioning protein
LSDALTAKVQIRLRGRRGDRGEIAIAFDSVDELNGLLDKIGAHER